MTEEIARRKRTLRLHEKGDKRRTIGLHFHRSVGDLRIFS